MKTPLWVWLLADRSAGLVLALPAITLTRDLRPVSCLECLAGHPDVSFGQHLKAHRRAAKLTQQEPADRTELHQTVCSRLERDQTEPDWPTLTRLLGAFGLRLLQVSSVQPLPPVRRQR